MPKYTIVLESLWVDNGCDCCEPVDIGVYRIKKDGEYLYYPVTSSDDPRYPVPMGWSNYQEVVEYLFSLHNISVEFEDRSDEV